MVSVPKNLNHLYAARKVLEQSLCPFAWNLENQLNAIGKSKVTNIRKRP